MKLSNMADRLQGQAMFQILDKVKNKKDLIHFEIGDPSYDTPWDIIEATRASIVSGDTHYVSSGGIDELKEAAQEVTQKSRGFLPKFEQLLVTPGANWQIYAAIACTCNPGDVVLIPNPGFVSYKSICEMLGVIAIDIKMYQGKLDLSAYSPQIISKIRMIILNSPCNPTGKMLTKDEITDIYNFALSNNIWLLSDEIYARMCYEKYFYSASMIDHCDNNVIIVNGFSKSYAMTGWRLGVMTGPENLIRKCQLLLETEQTCVPPFIQYAGVEALRMSQESIQDMMWGLRIKRSAMVVGLRQIGFNCDLPDGAFYVWAGWNGAFGIDISRRLLEYNVVVAPGSIFGSEGAYHIRLCFAVPESRIKEGLNKIEMAMRLT